MTKLAPEWVRTSDPVFRSPARYRWTTAPARQKLWRGEIILKRWTVRTWITESHLATIVMKIMSHATYMMGFSICCRAYTPESTVLQMAPYRECRTARIPESVVQSQGLTPQSHVLQRGPSKPPTSRHRPVATTSTHTITHRGSHYNVKWL